MVQPKQLLRSVRKDAGFRFRLTSAISMLSSVLFAVYNGILGLLHGSVWHIAIAIYYALLAGIRGALVITREGSHNSGNADERQAGRVCRITQWLLLVMNLALCAPAALMVLGHRDWTFGMIPAIAVAAYTTCRITLSILNYRRTRKGADPIAAELRTVNLVDSLVAVLSLQNTLIVATGAGMRSMIRLTGWTSAGILLLILFITIRSLKRTGRHGGDRAAV